ncbi:MAG: hypothetical protein M0Q51_15555 [Bacteroidales bacterium]|nr:hypothetical protein [Bacteroidales bacterium]
MYQRLLERNITLPDEKKFSNEGEFPLPHIPELTIKAIVLGADPTNPSEKRIEYVFDLYPDESLRNRGYSWIIENNLKSIGLSWHHVYVQNLCKNYFNGVTSIEKENWLKAAEVWVGDLREELDSIQKIPSHIPILATTYYIVKALVTPPNHYKEPKIYYGNDYKNFVPLPPDNCMLNRPLIPFYRSTSYYLGNNKRNGYRDYIAQLIKE